MRYIDADKLMLHLNDYKLQVSPSWKDKWERMVSCLVIDTCMEAVQEQPTADVRENVNGRWVEVVGRTEMYDKEGVKTWGMLFQCNKCGFVLNAVEGHTGQYNYCPNCGADMRGDNNGKRNDS